ILGAAATVVERSGAAHLTIEAVAAEAKLSKGGVLYHFPNKRSMLEGMVQHLLGRVVERSARYRAELAGGRNVTVRSLILAEQELDSEDRAMSLAILAAAAEDPGLLKPARELINGWFDDIGNESGGDGDGVGDQIGVLLLLATEGLRFLGMLNLLPIGSAERTRLNRRMLSIAEAGRL
ncbi:MAG: TetR/AcrR family transcriptional regulator, partial [Gammaproteobacteria bacterium]|nr:TetR/AcrR family transcriptional regulator [Gammaproteobacteria bacterium]